jgi:hypothetical protein
MTTVYCTDKLGLGGFRIEDTIFHEFIMSYLNTSILVLVLVLL